MFFFFFIWLATNVLFLKMFFMARNTTQSVLNQFTSLLEPTLRAYSICYLLSLSHIHALIWVFSLTSSSFWFLLSQISIMMKPEEWKNLHTWLLCVFVRCCVFLFICFRVLHRFYWRKKYTMKLPSNRVRICEYINKPIQRYSIPLYMNREHTM